MLNSVSRILICEQTKRMPSQLFLIKRSMSIPSNHIPYDLSATITVRSSMYPALVALTSLWTQIYGLIHDNGLITRWIP